MRTRPLLLLALFVAGPASAAELGLNEAIALSPSIRAVRSAEARLAAAQAGTVQAAAAWDPMLTVGADTSGSSNSGFIAGYPMQSKSTGTSGSVGLSGELPSATSWSVQADLAQASTTTITSLADVDTEQVRKVWEGLVSLSVTQDLLAPFRRSDASIQQRKSRESADVAELETALALDDAVEEVAREWWVWSAAYRSAELAAEDLEEARHLAEVTRALSEEGQVAPLEVSRVEAERLAAERTLLAEQATARQAGQTLFATLGMSLDSDLVPSGSGAIASGEVPRSEAEERALSVDLDVAIAKAEVDAQKEALRDARREYLPTVDLTGSVGVASLTESPGTALSMLATDPLPRWSIGVSVGVPLGGRAASGSAAAQEANLTVAELALADAEDATRLAVRAALDDVDVARSAVQLAAAQLEVARATEEGEQARLEEGLTRFDDLLVARNDRIAAQTDLIDAEAERARAELILLRQLGRLGELGAL